MAKRKPLKMTDEAPEVTAYTALSSRAGPAASKPSTVSGQSAAGKGAARRASSSLAVVRSHEHHGRAVTLRGSWKGEQEPCAALVAEGGSMMEGGSDCFLS